MLANFGESYYNTEMMQAASEEFKYRYMHLNLAGERVNFCYEPHTREVSLQMFPGIIVDRFPVSCGHYLTHEELRFTIETKLDLFFPDHITFMRDRGYINERGAPAV